MIELIKIIIADGISAFVGMGVTIACLACIVGGATFAQAFHLSTNAMIIGVIITFWIFTRFMGHLL